MCDIFKNTYFEEYLRMTTSVVSFSRLYVHYLRHRFFNQKVKCEERVSYFYKIEKKDRWKKKKKLFSKFISENRSFSYLRFFRKCLLFRRILRRITPLKVFFIKDLAPSVAVHILFDLTQNIVDETAATFEPIH